MYHSMSLIPDEEIINLCLVYGQPQGWVTREKLTNNKDKGKIGSNRSVDVLLSEGSAFENFYWLEGPLPGDQGRRITVTHQGQPQQCSNCFSYDIPKYGKPLSARCPAQGNGNACKMMGTPRARMNPYMKELEKLVGYTTLKMKHARASGNVAAAYDISEEPNSEEELVFRTPIAERDEKILILEKEKEEIQTELPLLKEQVTKLSKQLEVEKKDKALKQNRVTRAMQITEHRVAEAIKSDYTFLTDNPELLSLLALFQERDDFNVDSDNKIIEPIKEDDFLSNISKNIHDKSKPPDFQVELAKERFGEVKNKVLEGLKGRWIKPNRDRRDSLGSFASNRSKRDRESLESDPRINKQRVTSPSK